MYRLIPDSTRVAASTRPGYAETSVGTFGDVETARAYIRSNSLNVGMTTNIVATISSGDTRITETVDFDPGDSGSNGFYVIYRGANTAGSSRTLGSSIVTGFSLWSGNIYRANVGTGLDIHTLWEDGVQGRKARSPKFAEDSSHPLARPVYRTTEGVAASSTILQYVSGNYSPAAWTLTDAQVVVWSGGDLFGAGGGHAINWFTDTVPISSLNLAARQFTVSHDTRYPMLTGAVGSRYFVQGVIDLLTDAGEFHYDSTAGYLYYIFSGDPSTAVVEIPRVTRVFEFTGDDETTRTKFIQLDNLGIEQSNFTSWYRYAYPNSGDSPDPHTYPEYDRVKSLPECRNGLIYMTNADHIWVTRCHLKNAGFSGIFLNDYNQNHRFEANLTEEIGDVGYYVDGKYPGEGDVLKNCVFYNCKIKNVGKLGGVGVGMNLMNTGGHSIQNCTLIGGPRNGIFIGAGTTAIPAADCYSRNNRVWYTSIADFGQDSGDMGGFGTGGINSLTGGPYLTNYLYQVTIDNITSTSSMNDQPCNAVFYDNASFGQNANYVMVTNTDGAACRLNDSGEHTVANSTFNADGTTNGSFNPALIDTANIGVTSTFPYA